MNYIEPAPLNPEDADPFESMMSRFDIAAEILIPGGVAPGPHTLEIRASGWFVSHAVTGSGDHRPLAWRVGEVELRERSRGGVDLRPASPA